MTGAATAYACAAAGLRVALLEADRIGHGASARGPGIVQQAPPVGLVDMEAQHGRRVAKAIWTAWRRAALDLAATVRRLNIRAGFTPADGLTWAQTSTAAKAARTRAGGTPRGRARGDLADASRTSQHRTRRLRAAFAPGAMPSSIR